MLQGGKQVKLKAVINGAAVEKEIDGSKRLIDFLREDLGLTGTKEGCSEGECGACTVILNGEAVPSCLFASSILCRDASLGRIEDAPLYDAGSLFPNRAMAENRSRLPG